jgi:hypothetical protein
MLYRLRLAHKPLRNALPKKPKRRFSALGKPALVKMPLNFTTL